MAKTVLVAGASGFVGSHLCTALVEAGHEVRAMSRHPEEFDGDGTPVAADVTDPESLNHVLDGVQVAYYLVHSLDDDDFEDTDADAALNFAQAAKDSGVEHIVYLGGLGEDDGDLSAHLRSRRQVEQLLGVAGVPVTALRAAVVIGHGSISWEMTRQLVAILPPVTFTPSWATTRTQPIALPDVIRYLVGVLDAAPARGRSFDIGGPDVLSYASMLRRAAAVQGKSLRCVPLPISTMALSAKALSMVTDVDPATARNLIRSMSNEVIVRDNAILQVVPGATIGYEDAVRLALADRAASLGTAVS